MDFEIKQAATLLNAIVAQQTGQTALAAINNMDDFVSVAETALKTGRDPVLNAISQVWRDTIFAVRDYDIPLSTLRRISNAIILIICTKQLRKLTFSDFCNA